MADSKTDDEFDVWHTQATVKVGRFGFSGGKKSGVAEALGTFESQNSLL